MASRLEEQTKKLGASVVTTLERWDKPARASSRQARLAADPRPQLAGGVTEIVAAAAPERGHALAAPTMIKEAVAKNASFIMRVRDQVLAEPHRLRNRSVHAAAAVGRRSRSGLQAGAALGARRDVALFPRRIRAYWCVC
jgi:hypothetical protein